MTFDISNALKSRTPDFYNSVNSPLEHVLRQIFNLQISTVFSSSVLFSKLEA